MDYERISLTFDGPVATVTLRRPEILNPIDHQTLVELLSSVGELNDRDDLRVMIVTATGRAFSAGGDIKEMETDTPESFEETAALYQELATAITAGSKIVIAALNGLALGGGLELALMCDLRIAAESAGFGLPDLHLGYSPTSGLTFLLTRIVGFGRAMHLAFDTTPIDAHEAWRLGLVGEIVADDVLLARASELATQVAGFPPTGVRLTKAGFYSAAETTLAHTLQIEMASDVECFVSPETQAAIAAFVADRKAVRRAAEPPPAPTGPRTEPKAG